jgi:hypothetical protein
VLFHKAIYPTDMLYCKPNGKRPNATTKQHNTDVYTPDNMRFSYLEPDIFFMNIPPANHHVLSPHDRRA